MDINIRMAEQSDAPDIAKIIMLAFGGDMCNTISSSNESNAVFDFLKALSLRDDTQYSYRNVLICCCGEEIAGGICAYDGADLQTLRSPLLEELKERGWNIPSTLTDETSAGEYYIDSLAVYPEFRRRGIASKLIEAALLRGSEKEIEKVGLLVDTENPKARDLYQKLGFEEVGTIMFLGHKMQHMQRENKSRIRF